VVGSFVSPKWTPQMAQIDELLRRFTPAESVTYTAVALNERGRERAAEFTPPLTPAEAVPSLSCSLCGTFPRRNANVTREDEIARWPKVVGEALRQGAREGGIGGND